MQASRKNWCVSASANLAVQDTTVDGLQRQVGHPMIKELDETIAGAEAGDLVLDDFDLQNGAEGAENLLQHRLVDVGVKVSHIQTFAPSRVGGVVAEVVHVTRRGRRLLYELPLVLRFCLGQPNGAEGRECRTLNSRCSLLQAAGRGAAGSLSTC